MRIPHFPGLIGLSGVAPDERRSARLAGRLFEAPMMLAALWIIGTWYTEDPTLQTRFMGIHWQVMLWLLFVTEAVVLTSLVRDRVRYIKGNWLNLVIIILGTPLLIPGEFIAGALRVLRVLIVLSVGLHVGGSVRNMLSRNELGTTLLASAIIILMGGFMIAAIDPAFDTPWDGVWWAWVTVTTVGYGDFVPVSGPGKLFASLLILLGIGLFSMITASMAAFFMSRSESRSESRILDAEEHSGRRLNALEMRLKRLEDKLDEVLEQRDDNRR